MSISHWGMFPYVARIISIPAGFRWGGDGLDMAELKRPDGWIEIVRD